MLTLRINNLGPDETLSEVDEVSPERPISLGSVTQYLNLYIIMKVLRLPQLRL